jgi:hypothetical protein
LRKEKGNGLAGGLREVGRVVRCRIEHGHNAAWGVRGGLTKWHMMGQKQGDIGVEMLS